MIDEDTNAGALALAAALKEQRKAKIAGIRAHWIKDGVESFISLQICPPPVEECALRLPVGRLLSPSGRILSEAVEVDYPTDWKTHEDAKRVAARWLESKD